MRLRSVRFRHTAFSHDEQVEQAELLTFFGTHYACFFARERADDTRKWVACNSIDWSVLYET